MTKRARRILLGSGLLFVTLLGGVGIWIGRTMEGWMAQQVRAAFPSPATVGSTSWRFPATMVIEKIQVPAPPGSVHEVPLVEAEAMVLKVPWWGILLRPAPAEVILRNPHVRIESGAAESLNEQIYQRLLKAGLIQAPSVEGLEEFEEEEEPLRLALISLRVTGGRLDFTDLQIAPDRPVLSIAGLELTAKLEGGLVSPTLVLQADGAFADPATGERIGIVKTETRTQLLRGDMDGFLKLWHGRLSNFRKVYFYAPQPFFFEGGAGGPEITWRLRNRNDVWVSMRCLGENLRIEGMVGDVPWDTILKVLSDARGTLDYTVGAEGRLDDPQFNIHDRLLSELDWLIKERCAAAGVRIVPRIFFGLEGVEELEEE